MGAERVGVGERCQRQQLQAGRWGAVLPLLAAKTVAAKGAQEVYGGGSCTAQAHDVQLIWRLIFPFLYVYSDEGWIGRPRQAPIATTAAAGALALSP